MLGIEGETTVSRQSSSSSRERLPFQKVLALASELPYHTIHTNNSQNCTRLNTKTQEDTRSVVCAAPKLESESTLLVAKFYHTPLYIDRESERWLANAYGFLLTYDLLSIRCLLSERSLCDNPSPTSFGSCSSRRDAQRTNLESHAYKIIRTIRTHA